MKTFSELIVCEHCDSVYRRRPLGAGEVARCARCAATLYRAQRLDVDHWLALTLTAAIAFVIANVCPVIYISLQGLRNEATLWESATALAQGPIALIALPLALSIIVLPGVQIALLAWLLFPARAGRRAPGFAPAMRLLAALRPWSMVEVCLLGILVAVVKLSHLLQVVPGAGLWATAGLMVLITLIANRDIHQLWELTEPDSPGPPRQGDA
ncbi:MAG: paraquat-inducible protein A [Candidatus Accumulibacter sp.]|jgi:paraquat-inducible protein A|nr:paraquat-inducible protein A [Accumulibacter sp.]